MVDNAIGTEEGEGIKAGVKQKKRKFIWTKSDDKNLVLGVDIQLDSSMEVENHILVGRAMIRHFKAKEIDGWI